MLGPLVTKPVNLDRHGLAYLKRNKIPIIFQSTLILIAILQKTLRFPSDQIIQPRLAMIGLFEAEYNSDYLLFPHKF
jgi:hypothetical protein